MYSDPSKMIVRALGDYLKANMPSLQSVIENFPGPSEELEIPALSIFVNRPTFANALTYEVSRTPTTPNAARVLYAVGDYDFQLQCDIWAGNKEERYKLFSEFFTALNKRVTPMGALLSLGDGDEGYYGEIYQYTQVGYSFEENEAGAQKAEYRVRISVLATGRALLEKEESLMRTIETQMETTDTI